jgi:hypothetical protein
MGAASIWCRASSTSTAADGIAAVRRARRRGYDFIKPYQFLNRETCQAIVEESARQGFITTGHLSELGCPSCADRAFVFAHPLTNIAHSEELARFARVEHARLPRAGRVGPFGGFVAASPLEGRAGV